jgi:hypothetical protein
MKDHSTDASQSSSSSSPSDLPLFIHTSTPEEQEMTTLPSLLNENTVGTVNIKHQISSKATNPSSIISKKNISAARKRSAGSEEPIALRLKRSRLK